MSPTQVNFLLPPDLAPFGSTVQVKNPAGTSATLPLTMQGTAGQMFTGEGRYILATRVNGTAVRASAPAAKGETITIYGTGLGATNPAQTAGQVSDGAALATLPTVTIGGGAGTVISGSAVAGAAGLYALTVQVPAGAASGDFKAAPPSPGVGTHGGRSGSDQGRAGGDSGTGLVEI